jgi:ankyrin repeat protein
MSLPDNPHLDHLRRQARALQRAIRAGDAEAVARTRGIAEPGPDPGAYPLHSAQLVLARGYGFASWAKLKHYVDMAAEHAWQPLAERAGESLPDRFCRYACLTYTDGDGPHRWEQAQALLAEDPAAIAGDVWAAAAAGLSAEVHAALVGDPGLARVAGGPYGWTPLCYLAYSRVVPGDATEAARALLDAGADPDEGHLWNAQPYPFTILTGLFGDGEQGTKRQPPHPHAGAIARLVLAAGADPNDSQTLYNRQFASDDSHLELLFAFGLGRGDGGPWRRRLGGLIGSPSELLRSQLRWAVEHGMVKRVRLLVAHGVDVTEAYPDGRTPMDLARLGGLAEVAEALREGGAPPARLNPVDRAIAAVFAGTAPDEDAASAARSERPGLIVWAAAQGRADVVATLVALGWDVNARGRGDVPVEHGWHTALHEAAGNGDPAMIELLLGLGADRTLRDVRFHATPLDWARHFDHREAIRCLE